jgi:hypothetical protein
MRDSFKVFLFTFFFVLGLVYFGCSMYSSNWDPIMWLENVKKVYVPVLIFDIVISFLISWVTSKD